MRLYHGDEVIMSVHIPYAWKKALIAKAKKEKTTVNDILRTALEKKFGKGSKKKEEEK
jgi:NRPS condensation-like uncharacterized protein